MPHWAVVGVFKNNLRSFLCIDVDFFTIDKYKVDQPDESCVDTMYLSSTNIH